jgi:ATP synthase F1 delta subunit
VSVATTYAEALFEAAVDRSALEAVRRDLGAFVAALSESSDLAHALHDPEIDTRTKKSVVRALTGDAEPLLANFLQVLLDRGRIEELADIARAFETRVAEEEGRLEIHAVTAVPLDDEQRRAILARVEAQTGRAATLTESVDPDIVGGLVLRAGGLVVDASVRSRLEDLRQRLTHTPVETALAAD